MSKKNDLKAELEGKGIEFDPKAKIAELEELNAEPEAEAPDDTVEPEKEKEAPKPSKFISGKFVENAPVLSANLVNGIMEVKTNVAGYRMSEEEYENLKDPNEE